MGSIKIFVLVYSAACAGLLYAGSILQHDLVYAYGKALFLGALIFLSVMGIIISGCLVGLIMTWIVTKAVEGLLDIMEALK